MPSVLTLTAFTLREEGGGGRLIREGGYNNNNNNNNNNKLNIYWLSYKGYSEPIYNKKYNLPNLSILMQCFEIINKTKTQTDRKLC